MPKYPLLNVPLTLRFHPGKERRAVGWLRRQEQPACQPPATSAHQKATQQNYKLFNTRLATACICVFCPPPSAFCFSFILLHTKMQLNKTNRVSHPSVSFAHFVPVFSPGAP
jgi:hypothetical protein